MRSGEEIQAALKVFVTTWASYQGTEQSEAQSFLNGLVECYGLDRQAAGMLFEHTVPGRRPDGHVLARSGPGGDEGAEQDGPARGRPAAGRALLARISGA